MDAWKDYAKRYRAMGEREREGNWNRLTPEQQAELRKALEALPPDIPPPPPTPKKKQFGLLSCGCFSVLLLIVLLAVLIPTGGPAPDPPSPEKQRIAAEMEEDLINNKLRPYRSAGLREIDRRDSILELRWEESDWVVIPFSRKKEAVSLIGRAWDICKNNTIGRPGYLIVRGYRSGRELASYSELTGPDIK